MSNFNPTDLDDITATFNDIAVFSMEEEVQLHNDSLLIIDEYVQQNIKDVKMPNFSEQLEREVFNILHMTIRDAYDYDIETELRTVVLYALNTYYKSIMPKRECKGTFIRCKPNVDTMAVKIDYLRNKPQPEQRSQEWYEFRHTLITASSVWQAIDSQSCIDRLIVDKCKPISVHANTGVNTESPFHWGVKYEEVSVMIYNLKYNTKVEDFGCIPHDTHKFIGASPDGINTDPSSKRYGRMLEIKNIVNRDITGIPKKEYWIQMQFQMETCNLNECDFLETRIKEYENKEAFDSDGTFNKTKNGNYKGILLYFLVDNKPYYEYCPLTHTEADYIKWEQEMMTKHEADTWIKNLYWYLDELSCVLVLRNKLWFNSVINDVSNVWDTIIKERISGYEHRIPKRRANKSPQINGETDEIPKGVCLINLEEESSVETNDDNKVIITDTPEMVIKINTK